MQRTTRPRAIFFVILSAVAFALAWPSAAQEFRVEGSWRLRYAQNTDLVLDDTGTRLEQHDWFEHRIRLTPKVVEEGSWEVQASADILSGLFAGDLARDFAGLGWDGRSVKNGFTASGFDFRTLFGTVRFPVGQLMIGQRGAQWGMGLLANNGNDETNIDFGDARFGDLVDGALFATKPLLAFGMQGDFAKQVVSALSLDVVYRDRYAELVQRDSNGLHWGDVAWQGVFATMWDPSERSRLGFYVARRWQEFANDAGDLHIWVFDLHAKTGFAFESIDSTLALETEGTVINGRSSHITNLNSLTSTQVLQSGAAARARLAMPGGLETELEGGFASGDSNPFDGTSAGFQSNRDFKVSLVLFDEVLLFQTQNAARRLADPNLVGLPPNGINLLPTEGAVSNALYIKPTVRWRPPFFHSKIRLTGAVMYAIAPEPYVDAYQSFVASAPRNPFGAVAKTHYGTELDGAISWNEKFGPIGVELGAQYGVLFPGDAFDNPDGSSMGKVAVFKGRLGLSF